MSCGALRAWLKDRGRRPGPLSTGRALDERITESGVSRMVHRCCEACGIDADYGTHSLRAGFVPETVIMQRTGHRSVQTVARYVRPASLFSVDALAKAL